MGDSSEQPVNPSDRADRLCISRQEATIESLPLNTVLSNLAETARDLNIDLDPDVSEADDGTLHTSGKQNHWLVSVVYRWSVKPAKGSYTVTETLYLSRYWLLPLIAVCIGIGIGLLNLYLYGRIPQSYVVVGGYITVLVSIPGFVLVFAPDIVSKEVLPELDLVYELDNSEGMELPFLATNSFFFIAGVLGYFYGFYWLTPLSGFLCIGVGFAAWYRYDEIAASHMSFSYSQYVPTPTGEYFFFVLASLIPIASIRFAPIFGEVSEDLLSVVAVAEGVFLVALLLYYSASEERLLLKTFAHGGERYVDNRLIQLIFLSLSIAVSYTGVLAASWLIQQTDSVGGVPINFPMAILIVLPLLYFWIGLLIQPVGLLRQLRQISQNTHSAGFSEATSVDPDVLVSSKEIGPLAYSTGLDTRIVVPEHVVELLDSGELEAVLAHEEAHAKINSDSFLSFLSPLVGIILLTGQNVLYSFLDFRKREFRADRYAAERAGSENLQSAFRTLEQASLNADVEQIQTGLAFTPFTPFIPERERVSGFVAERFSLFFGGFALSKAHPSIEERIDHINRLELQQNNR